VFASRIFFVLLVLALSPRAAAQHSLTSSHPGGWWNEEALAPLPIYGSGTFHREAGGIVDAPAAPFLVAESVRPIPARDALAVPNVGFPLFALDERHPERPTNEPAEPRPAETALYAPAESETVQRRAETVYYDIEGGSWADLAAALRERGPRAHGRQFFGLTEWEMSVEYRPVADGAGCAVDDLTIEVSVKTHLPRWSRAAAAPTPLRRAWNRFVAALGQHEQGHRVLAERAAETASRRLRAASAPTCDRLDAEARREVATVMQEYERRQLAYDVETGHGRTQGAVWPPAHGHQVSAR
jgi:predicted secreted Zn-dependent protease